jgi:hypothetical protein
MLCPGAAPVFRGCACVQGLRLCPGAAPVFRGCACVQGLRLCSGAAPVQCMWPPQARGVPSGCNDAGSAHTAPQPSNHLHQCGRHTSLAAPPVRVGPECPTGTRSRPASRAADSKRKRETGKAHGSEGHDVPSITGIMLWLPPPPVCTTTMAPTTTSMYYNSLTRA